MRREPEDVVRSVNRPSQSFFLCHFLEQNILQSVVEVGEFQSRQILSEGRIMGFNLAEELEGPNVVFGAGLEADVAEIVSIKDNSLENIAEH
jgi:hypothetical protein